MVWYGLIWFDMVYSGFIWFNMVLDGLVSPGDNDLCFAPEAIVSCGYEKSY